MSRRADESRCVRTSLWVSRDRGGFEKMSTEPRPWVRTLAGRCECRAVRYLVADEFLYAANCHCSNCRASTGSAFKPFAGIEREKLEVTDGLDTLLIVGNE